MAKLQTKITDTGRGKMASVTNVDTAQTQHLFIPNNLPNGLEQPAAALLASVAIANAEIERASATYVPELIGPHLLKAIPPLLAGPYSDFVRAVGTSARENKKVIVDISAVVPSTPAVAAIRARAVKLFDMAPTVADKIRLAANVFDLPKLSGLVEVEALSILPDDVQASIMDRFLILQYASKYGIASKYPAIATADFPIPSGINVDAVHSEAKTFVDAVRNHTMQIENCSQVARDCILFVSIACQCPVDQAFTLLTGNKA